MTKIRTCAISLRAKHNGKAGTIYITPRGGQQRLVNKYTLGRQRGQAKWLTDALVRLRFEFCTFAKRLFYEKKTTFLINGLLR